MKKAVRKPIRERVRIAVDIGGTFTDGLAATTPGGQDLGRENADYATRSRRSGDDCNRGSAETVFVE